MPLETATLTSGLVASNPAASDGMNNTDDHLRLIKQVLLNTLSGVNSVLTRPILSSFGFLPGDGAASAPAYAFASEPSLGFWRSAAGVITCAGGVVRSASEAGKVEWFATQVAPTGWLVCDGQAISRTTYADLFTAIGTLWGAGDGSTTFNIPNLKNRFPRHRDAAGDAGGVGTVQASQNKSHTHTASGSTAAENQNHSHTFSGNTGVMSANATHTHPINGQANIIVSGSGSGVGGGGSFGIAGSTQLSNGSTNTDHTHSFSGSTSIEVGTHTHDFNVTTSGGTADGTDARPLSATLLACIKY